MLANCSSAGWLVIEWRLANTQAATMSAPDQIHPTRPLGVREGGSSPRYRGANKRANAGLKNIYRLINSHNESARANNASSGDGGGSFARRPKRHLAAASGVRQEDLGRGGAGGRLCEGEMRAKRRKRQVFHQLQRKSQPTGAPPTATALAIKRRPSGRDGRARLVFAELFVGLPRRTFDIIIMRVSDIRLESARPRQQWSQRRLLAPSAAVRLPALLLAAAAAAAAERAIKPHFLANPRARASSWPAPRPRRTMSFAAS